MALEEIKNAGKMVVGTRQTVKAVENESARKVFIARDAEERVTFPVIRSCQERNIPVRYVDSMEQLGKACNIKVGAAVAAIVEEEAQQRGLADK